MASINATTGGERTAATATPDLPAARAVHFSHPAPYVCSWLLLRRIESLGVAWPAIHFIPWCRAVARDREPRLRHQTRQRSAQVSLPRVFLGVIGRAQRPAAWRGKKNLPTTWVGNGRAGRCVRACVRVGLTYGLGLQGLEATQTAAAAADGPVTRGPCSPTLPNQDTEKSERARAGGRPYRPARTRVQESNAGSALQCSCNA